MRIMQSVRTRSWLRAAAAVAAMLACTLAQAATVQAGTRARADGSLIHWSLTPPLHAAPDARSPRGVLLVAQGSGCHPASASASVAAAHAVAPALALLTVEKYGVSPHDRPADAIADCSQDYRLHHTVSQRAADALQVLQALRDAPGWSGPLVLFGGSEGGAVVAQLAPLARPDAVVVMSSSLGETLADTIRRVVPPPVARQLDAVLAQARRDPASGASWGGASARWWADVADTVPARALLSSAAPVLLVQGERDALAPVASARLAQQAYREAGHGGLTYWELPGHDHFMVDAHGVDQRDRVLGRVATWVADRLAERARTGADEGAVDGSAVGATMPDADLLRWHRSMRRLHPWG